MFDIDTFCPLCADEGSMLASSVGIQNSVPDNVMCDNFMFERIYDSCVLRKITFGIGD